MNVKCLPYHITCRRGRPTPKTIPQRTQLLEPRRTTVQRNRLRIYEEARDELG